MKFLRWFVALVGKGITKVAPVVVKVAPVILAIVGLSMLAIGAMVDPEGHEAWRHFLVASGSAVLAGGVFSAVVKGNLFFGIFQEALTEVIYAERYVLSRKDLEQTWKKLGVHVAERRFPDLQSALGDLLLEYYLPRTRNFYYSEVSKDLKIESYDERKDVLVVVDITRLEIRPHSDAPFIDYHYKYTKSEQGAQGLEALSINGLPVADYEKYRCSEDNHQPAAEGEVALRLPVSSYTIVRESRHLVPRAKAPFLRVSYNTYVQRCIVIARSEVAGFNVKFEDLGTPQKFTSLSPDPRVNDRDFKMEYKQLLLPRQGYIVLFVDARPCKRRDEEEEGCEPIPSN